MLREDNNFYHKQERTGLLSHTLISSRTPYIEWGFADIAKLNMVYMPNVVRQTAKVETCVVSKYI